MSWISDVKYELDKLDFSIKKLRSFGILVGSIILFLTSWIFSHNLLSVFAIFFFAIGVSLVIFGLFFPSKLSVYYKVWMGIAFALGWIVSRFLLIIIFFIILTPIALTALIFRKKFLNLKIEKQESTYWISKRNEINYEKMF